MGGDYAGIYEQGVINSFHYLARITYYSDFGPNPYSISCSGLDEYILYDDLPSLYAGAFVVATLNTSAILVPEPATILLVCEGFVCLAGFERRLAKKHTGKGTGPGGMGVTACRFYIVKCFTIRATVMPR